MNPDHISGLHNSLHQENIAPLNMLLHQVYDLLLPLSFFQVIK